MLRRLLPLVLLLLAAGCDGPLIPQEEPFIVGRITGITPERTHYRVEAVSGLGSEVSEAVVRVTADTDVLLPGAREGHRDLLEFDALVSVWITGPIQDSQPPQVTARTVLIHAPETVGD